MKSLGALSDGTNSFSFQPFSGKKKSFSEYFSKKAPSLKS
jgi:hypothetical protein